ncbi:conserved hypothetical protein (plasmid) [Borreliella garinii Far04]|nr:conserved hypothetical protein [Borreliella garinii Far04]
MNLYLPKFYRNYKQKILYYFLLISSRHKKNTPWASILLLNTEREKLSNLI